MGDASPNTAKAALIVGLLIFVPAGVAVFAALGQENFLAFLVSIACAILGFALMIWAFPQLAAPNRRS